MSDRPGAIERLFTPGQIAIVGASEKGLYPAGILQSLLEHRYPGTIYPVNPNRSTVFGLPAYPDITAIHGPIDLAILTVPRQAVQPVIQQCLQRGVKAAMIITAGFAEADEPGRQLQVELTRAIRGSELRLVGPNCAGLANIPAQVIAARLPAPPRPGNISFISQSGALMMAFYGLYHDRKIGMNRLISLGNQVDVSLAECLDCLVEHHGSHVITVFMEGLTDGRAFVAAAKRAIELGKPIVLLKSGRTQAGQRAAASHTAALSGSQRVFQAICRQFGVVLVDDLNEMVMTAQIFDYLRSKIHDRFNLALVTQSGGLGSLTADLCAEAGISLHPLSQGVRARLLDLPHLFHFGELDNPLDVRAGGLSGPQTIQTLAPLLEDEDTDALLLLLAKQLARPEDLETAEAIIAAAKDTNKPVMVVWMGPYKPLDPQARLASDLLLEGGIPTFEQPGDCTRALGRCLEYYRFRQRWLSDPELRIDDYDPDTSTLPALS
jgi:acyl-CoA synthetase (NDP forming)